MPSILMLEHDDDDQLITRSTFEENGFAVQLQFATDSDDFFRRISKMKEVDALPSLFLVSHRCFPLSSTQVLRKLKADPLCARVPVVILGAPMPPHLVDECYVEGAASVIVKPMTHEGAQRKIASFFEYWFNTASLTQTGDTTG